MIVNGIKLTYYGIIKDCLIDDFLIHNIFSKYWIGVQSFETAYSQEFILQSQLNKNYHFNIWMDNRPCYNGKPMLYLELKFDDDFTKIEYELVK